jgi:hypothetical protein
MNRSRGCFCFIESSPMLGDPPPPQWRVRFIWRRTVVQKDHTPALRKCKGNVVLDEFGVPPRLWALGF